MLLIQNVLIADPKSMTERLGDVLIKEGKIAEIAAPNSLRLYCKNLKYVPKTPTFSGSFFLLHLLQFTKYRCIIELIYYTFGEEIRNGCTKATCTTLFI